MLGKVNWDYLKQIKDPYLFFKAMFFKADKKIENNNRVLIVVPCLIGDFMVATRAIALFAKNNPSLSIDLVVSPPLKEIAQRIKRIKNVFVSKSSTARKIEDSGLPPEIKSPYDKIIIMRLSEEAYDLVKNTQAKKFSSPFFKVMKFQFLFGIRDILLSRKPLERINLDLALLNQKSEQVYFEDIFNFKKEDYKKITSLPFIRNKRKVILVHTGSDWIMKKWSNLKWAELLNKINSLGKYAFVFIGGKDSEEDYNEISKKLNFKSFSLIDKISLLDLLLLMRKSKHFIGIDSGPRNMAHMADLRSITLLGPSGKLYMPFNKKDIVIDKANVWDLYETFFYKKNSAVERITVGEVFNAFKKLKAIP